MKWLFSLFGKPKTDLQPSLDRYRELRKAGRELNMAIVKQLPKVAAPECGKKLGLVKAGTLILNNDDEISILYDYCLHHYRRGGKNAIERFVESTPPQQGSDAELVLQAMLDSRFSAFEIRAILPHLGAVLRNLITGEEFKVMDLSLCDTGRAGMVVVGRMLPMGDFQMSSGTLIPLPVGIYEQKIRPVIDKFVKPQDSGPVSWRMSAGQEASFVAELIRVALYAGGEDNMFYTDIEPCSM